MSMIKKNITIDKIVSKILLKALNLHKNLKSNKEYDIFNMKTFPTSDDNFLFTIEKIIQFSEAESSTVISTIAMIDYLIRKKKLILNRKNIYNIFCICLLLSLKYLEDEIFPESYYCQVLGFSQRTYSYLEFLVLEKFEYSYPFNCKLYKEYSSQIYL